MRRADAPPVVFSLPVRVYYQDTDAGGVVFHANYLAFFERARTEWLRRLGFDIGAMAREGLLFIVREVRVSYSRPAFLDDALEVTVGVEHLGRAQFTLEQRVERGAELLARGSINLGCVSAGEFRPLRVPDSLRAALIAHRVSAPGPLLTEDG
jgi:tol-pal system-associated acyl-CoA thioesterase